MQRIVIVNLHSNPMLVKLLEKFIFKQSFAVKHKYLLDYLLSNDEFEVCSYINAKGFSLANNLPKVIMKIFNAFRFQEHKITLRKNDLPLNKIKVLNSIDQIQIDDIVIAYRHCGSSLFDLDKIDAFRAVGMIHFWGTREESNILRNINPEVLFSESDLSKYSEIFRRYYDWYKGDFIIHPFVFAPRFKKTKPFSERINKAFATGTITYKDNEDFLEVYGDSCDQPARKQIKDNIESLKDLIYCTSSDYSENAKTVKIKKNANSLLRFYRALHYKLFESQQKQYYSFDMVKSFNDYKMCIVGEEILGIPGIGFVEGMACGCAYIGQTTGYYEDYGMKEGVHYIGYDGTLDDLKSKIAYYQMPEHQEELERIADAGYEFAMSNFNGSVVAKSLMDRIVKAQREWLKSWKNECIK